MSPEETKKDHNFKSIVNLFFEVGALAQTPRSGFFFLGSGSQSVAEHTNRVAYIGMVLAMLDSSVDSGKVVKMCLLHDLAEARTSDLNYVHQKYVTADEESAIYSLAKTLDFGNELLDILREYKERQTKEAILAKDADNIEWILSLKEQADIGNARAESWMPSAIKRLKTEVARKVAMEILTTKADEWWFKPDDDFWVNRTGANMDKRW